jgi:tetratricopeptide (TPR) repeat protein
MAYRGLGNVVRAEAELAKHGPAAPTLVDPYVTELQDLKTGTANLWTRASQQMAAGDLPAAIGTYRKLVEVNESDPVAKTYLGTALARAGNTDEAIQQFNEALTKAPTNTETHYCLGVVLAELGKDNEAIAHFRATVKGDSQFTEAHFQLANVLMRTQNYSEAAAEYSETVERDPKNAFASLMKAMALVRLSRYADARSALECSHKTLPQDPDIANALARLLAAAPDNNVRDGKRALEIMQELLKNDGNADTDQAETIAMALAETSQFEKAAGVQRSVIGTAPVRKSKLCVKPSLSMNTAKLAACLGKTMIRFLCLLSKKPFLPMCSRITRPVPNEASFRFDRPYMHFSSPHCTATPKR